MDNEHRLRWQKFFRPLFIFFLLINTTGIFFKNWLHEKGIDATVILAANALLFLLSLLNGAIRMRSIKSTNPNVAVRSITGGSFLKLIVVAFAVLIYLFTAGEERDVYAVLIAMVLYIFYTFIETKGLLKMNRKEDGNG